tara:strand:+ start:990 stop:1295 length:306 start_codon:yes stop_codon:yes gene_type:complete
MNIIYYPEQNTKLLRYYHLSSKALIPLALGSYLSYKYENKTAEKIFHTANILNIGFHSYVSSSCVITDYIKPLNLSRASRGLSFSIHGLAIYGYLNNLYKK